MKLAFCTLILIGILYDSQGFVNSRNNLPKFKCATNLTMRRHGEKHGKRYGAKITSSPFMRRRNKNVAEKSSGTKNGVSVPTLSDISESASLRQNSQIEAGESFEFYQPPLSVQPRSTSSSGRVGPMNKVRDFVVDNFVENDLQDLADSSLKARLVSKRMYALSTPYEQENLSATPTLNDLGFPPDETVGGFWSSVAKRVLIFVGAYTTFPWFMKFLHNFVTMSPSQLLETASTFGPGISILYGTFTSLTISILYDNQRQIQERAVTECSLVAFTLRNFLSLFKYDEVMAVRAGQYMADQIRTLVKSSRGTELLQITYSDPYARLHALLDETEERLADEGGWDYMLNRIVTCRDLVLDLQRIRAERLAEEGVCFPPTHYTVLNLLTLLILLSYCISILPSVDSAGFPSNESSILFAVLASVFIFFEQFIADLSGPFEGDYQIRRSSTASHLLQAKLLIANHPLLKGKIDFNINSADEATEIVNNSQGKGEIRFDIRKNS